MIVNNNLSALHIFNVLDKKERELKKSLKNLSSGSRLNGAGDSPAEYAISQKMRTQIRSLEQAKRNAENGKSMMRTAERALDSTTDILARMKEITLEAANDTSSASDREIMQREISHLAQALDEVAYNTEFNEIALLNGQFQTESHAGAFSDMRVESYSQAWLTRKIMLRPNELRINPITGTNFLVGDKVRITDPMGGGVLDFVFEKDGMPAAKDGAIGVKVGATMADSVQNFVDAVKAATNNRVDFSITTAANRISLKWPGHSGSDLENLFADFGAYDDVLEKTELGGHYEIDLQENFAQGDVVEIAGHKFVAGGNGVDSFSIGSSPEESLQNLLQSLQKACGKQIPETAYTPSSSLTKANVSTNLKDIFRSFETQHISTIPSSTYNSMCDAIADAVIAGKSTAEIRGVIRSALQGAGYSDADLGGSDIVDGLALCAQSNMYGNELTSLTSGIVGRIIHERTSSTYGYVKDPTNQAAFEKAAWHAGFAILNAIVDGKTPEEAAAAALETGSRHYDGVGQPTFYELMTTTLDLLDGIHTHPGELCMQNIANDTLKRIHEVVPFPDDLSRFEFSAEGSTLSIKERFVNEYQLKSNILGRDIDPPVIQSSGHHNGTPLSLQIGTKSNQTVQINIEEMSAKALGIVVSPGTDASGRVRGDTNYTVDVLTQKSAQKSIDVIDDAVQTVVLQKASLGSIQSRLEYTADNLTTAAENTTGAESTLADTNMAREMVRYQSRSVLSQAGQAMLAQANTAPERVLQLLQ